MSSAMNGEWGGGGGGGEEEEEEEEERIFTCIRRHIELKTAQDYNVQRICLANCKVRWR